MNDRTIGRAGFLGILGAGAARALLRQGLHRRCSAAPCRSRCPRSCRRRAGGSTPSASSMPNIDPTAYRLRVDGLVDAPKSFTLADLKAMPRAEQVSDFHCVTGWVVSERALGRRAARRRARARRGARQGLGGLRFVSAEMPYEDSLTLKQALLPDVMLAYEMDGGPLSATSRRAGPARDARRCTATRASSGSNQIELVHGAAGRLLGAARLRRGRLARPVEWFCLTHASGRVERALHPHRAGAPLDARGGVLRPPRDRADPLPAGARRR